MSSLPAHHTKHVPLLLYHFPPAVFHLAQRSDGVSNGTALWLGGQCLAAYLAARHPAKSRLTALELGSGIGLTALALASLGWNVLATDIPDVIHTVLAPNIRDNRHCLPHPAPTIQVRHLDWTVPPDQWSWEHPAVIASHDPPTPCDTSSPLLAPPFDLICSADTVYSADLVQPLLRTIHALSTLSAASSRPPTVLLCLERRDPQLVDYLLAEAKNTWHFTVSRVPHSHLVKAVEKHAATPWDKADWEGVEIWKLKLQINR